MANQKKAQVVITANAAVAKKIIDELNQRIATLKQKMNALDVSTKQGQKDFNKLQKELISYNSAAVQNITKTERIDKAMKNLSKTSLADLKRALAAAKSELNKMSAEDPGLKKMQNNIKAIQGQIDNVTGSAKKQDNALLSLVKHGAQMIAMYASLNTVVSTIKNVFNGLVNFSNELTDIRKVSGLTTKEVRSVSEAIMSIDTRTSVSELNKLAYAGSKLGIAAKYGVEGLAGFTKAADQLNVALKEDMGGDALIQVSKMAQVMGDMDALGVDKALKSISSSIFKLSSSTTANGANIVQFSQRLVGLAKASNMTTPEILALGSAADSMMLMPEVASTAMSKFITSLQTSYQKIEKDLQIPKNALKELLEQNRIVDAMVLVFEKMRTMGNMNALNFMFKDLGSEGARLKNVMITMAQNVDMLKEHIGMSNRAFKEGTAVTAEYILQQESAGGYMDRAANEWSKFSTNAELATGPMTELARAWYEFSKELTSSTSSWVMLRVILYAITTILKALLDAAQAVAVFFAVKFAQSLWASASAGLGLSGVLIRLQDGYKSLMNTLKNNVWSIIAVSIYNVIRLLSQANQFTEEATNRTKELAQAQAQCESEYQKEVKTLNQLYNRMTDANRPLAERKSLLGTFTQNYGQYLSKQVEDINNTKELASAYKEAKDKLREYMIYKNTMAVHDKVYTEPRVRGQATYLEAKTLDPTLEKLSTEDFETLVKMGMQSFTPGKGRTFNSADDIARWIVEDNPYNLVGKKGRYNREGIEVFGRQWRLGFSDKAHSASDVLTRAVQEIMTANEGLMEMENDKYWRQGLDYEPPSPKISTYIEPHPDTHNNPTHPDGTSTTTVDNPAEKAKRDFQTIIANLKAYYDIQQAALTDMLAMSEATEQEQTDAIRAFQERRVAAFSAMRNTFVFGLKDDGTNEWNDFRETLRNDWYTEENNMQALDMLTNLLSEDLIRIHEDIQKETIRTTSTTKYKAVYGEYEKWKNGDQKDGWGVTGYDKKTSTSTKVISNIDVAQALMASQFAQATGEELKLSKVALERMNARRKESLEHDYTGLVDKNTINGLEMLGFVTIDPLDPHVKELRQSVQNVLLAVRNNIVKVMQTDEQDILELLWGKNYKTKLKDTPFADLLDASEEDVKIFYRKLIQYNDEYIEAQKKAYAEQKKIWDFMWSKDPARKVMEDTIAKKKSQIDVFGSQQSLMRGWGLTDIDQDPEVRLLSLKLELAQEYYNYIKEHSNDELLIEEAQKGVRTALLESIKGEVQAIKDRGEKIQAFMQPTYDAVESLGDIWIAYKDSAEEGQQAMIKSLRNFIKQYSVMLLQGLTNKAKEGILNGVALKKLSKQYNITEAELKKGRPRKAKSVSAGEVKATTDQPDESLTDTFKAKMKERGMEDYATEETSPVDAQIDTNNGLLDATRLFHKQMLSEEVLYQEMLREIRENPENKDSIMAEYETRLTAEKDYSEEQVAIRKAGFDAMKKLSLAGWQSLLKNEKEGNEKKAEITETTEQGITEVTAANESTRLATQQATQSMSLNSFMEKTVGDVLLGIAGGSAKTVGELGWWGLPLVGVLSAALMGLLNYALSFVGNIGGGSSKSGPNTKLVSGMLTYDSGNVQTYAGTDGNYYSAQSVSRLSTGIVTSPIATTVNGAPALVGERGPEIVVGRETTAAIMRNDPGLLRMLVGYDKMYSGRRRTYDEGNVSVLPVPGNASSDTQMADLMTAILFRLENPIAPNINMYGRDGLHSKMQQANQFMKGK